jgi:hypothetical protein
MVCPPDMVHLAVGPMKLGPKNLQMADYCLDQHEVTAEEYDLCVQASQFCRAAADPPVAPIARNEAAPESW